MDFINQILPIEILHALGWTVIHSLWQAFAIALLLAAYLLAFQKTDARKRYFAGNMALGSILLLASATFVFYLKKEKKALGGTEIWGEEGLLLGQYFPEKEHSYFSEYFSQHMPLIVTVWLLGMVFFMLKMLGGLLYIQRLKTRMTAPLPAPWQEKLTLLSGQLNILRPVKLLESALTKTPIVVGWLKPIILLPMGAVNHLTPAQVEAILAHELAHVVRNDYLLNLLQSLVEVLFYFNPAVWWISTRVRAERENCCDDIAVRLCGNSLAYAKALVGLQEMQLVASPPLAMTFSRNKKQLLFRIQRILQPSQNKSNVMEKLSATLLLTVAVVLLSVQANTPFGNLISRVAAKALPLAEFPVATVPADAYVAADTIPDGTHNAHIHYNDDNENIEFKLDNDKIVWLKVDGKIIPASEYDQYEGRIAEIMGNMPEPPEAPEAPIFGDTPNIPDMPDMPAPSSIYHEFPVPPAPPAPPVPPTRTRKIITQKDGNGTSFIIENEDGSDPVEIVVKDGKKGTIIVNGQEIVGMKKGDKTIIMQDVPSNFSWDEGQLGAFNADRMQFGFSGSPGFPQISPDGFAFSMPDASTWNSEEFRAMQEKMRDGKFNQEMMEEYARKIEEFQNAGEWEKLNDEMARMSEEQALQYELQRKEVDQLMRNAEIARDKAMRDAEISQGRMQRNNEVQQRKIEKERQQIEKERQKKRRSGSM